jgi:hypothetical protein
VAERDRHPADTIRRIAAEIADVAFEREVVIDRPWTDMPGRKHDKMIGRPVAMHAMRGISAHSNGFQTCRMRCTCCRSCWAPSIAPAASATSRPTPSRRRRPAKPHGLPATSTRDAAGRAASGLPARAGRPAARSRRRDAQRIDKAFSWDAPMSAHGMMHMVISNAARGSLRHRRAVPLHGQHGLELVDEQSPAWRC